MEIAVTTIPCTSVKSVLELHHLTDTHIDSPDFAEGELRERIQHIKNTEGAYWCHGGDIWSLILYNDKRFSGVVRADYQDALHSYPERCLERACELFEPIKDKMLAMGAGNHEAVVGKHFHRNLAAELAAKLGKPEAYIGDRGWVVLSLKYHTQSMTVTGYLYHGWSTGRLGGRKMIQSERDIGAWNADFIFLGHDHQPFHHVYYTEEIFNPGGKGHGYRLRQRPRAILNGGSWGYGQKQPSSEEEKKGWAKLSTVPAQSWVEGKNYRPQPPVVPYLMLQADFGHSSSRESSIAFDVRFPTSTFSF